MLDLLEILALAIAYPAIAVALVPRLARWVWPHWRNMCPHTGTQREAVFIGAILAVYWPLTGLAFGLALAEERIFGEGSDGKGREE